MGNIDPPLGPALAISGRGGGFAALMPQIATWAPAYHSRLRNLRQPASARLSGLVPLHRDFDSLPAVCCGQRRPFSWLQASTMLL
jgi:hypothetical protein